MPVMYYSDSLVSRYTIVNMQYDMLILESRTPTKRHCNPFGDNCGTKQVY